MRQKEQQDFQTLAQKATPPRVEMLTPSLVSPSTTVAKLHVKNNPSSDSLYGSSYVNILSQTKDLAATTRNMNLVNQAVTQESQSSLL